MDLAKRFRELRKSKGMSVYKLSKLSEVSENYIHAIEKGGNQPSVEIIERLLVPLGTSLSEFFSDSGDVLYPTPFDRELVESVRILDEEKALAVLNIAKLFSKP